LGQKKTLVNHVIYKRFSAFVKGFRSWQPLKAVLKGFSVIPLGLEPLR
jgi:hypothetical protein